MLLHDTDGRRGGEIRKRERPATRAFPSYRLPRSGASEPGAGDASPRVDADAQGSRISYARFEAGAVDAESLVLGDAAVGCYAEDRRATLELDAAAGYNGAWDGAWDGPVVLDRAVPDLRRRPHGEDHAEADVVADHRVADGERRSQEAGDAAGKGRVAVAGDGVDGDRKSVV